MPWQISTVHPPSLTFHDFWTKELVPRCPDRTLSQVYVGKAKESMDLALVRQTSNAWARRPAYRATPITGSCMVGPRCADD